jgi:phosphatidylethanolamine-binding protein (PEBP) family uncharacterized protein
MEEDVRVFRLKSPAFDDGQEMAQKYGNKVDNISPPLEWDGTPEGSPGFTEIKPYVGPFPPSGTHDYEFTLYALRVERLGIRPGATLQQFGQAAAQNSLATATLIGKFTKTR